MDAALPSDMPFIRLSPLCFKKIIHGNRVSLEQVEDSSKGVLPGVPSKIYCSNEFIGIGSITGDGAEAAVQIKNVLV